MPKKTTILIIILALITGVLIFLAVRSDQTQKFVNDALNPSPTESVTTPYAQLSFIKPQLNVSNATNPVSVDIVIDTTDKPTSGAQIELSYDPSVLTNMKVTPPSTSFFGQKSTVLINKVDQTQGRISYAVGISPSDGEKFGKGLLATLTFTVNPNSGQQSTQISFLEKSMVTSLQTPDSVLKSMSPLKIVLTPEDPATSVGN